MTFLSGDEVEDLLALPCHPPSYPSQPRRALSGRHRVVLALPFFGGERPSQGTVARIRIGADEPLQAFDAPHGGAGRRLLVHRVPARRAGAHLPRPHGDASEGSVPLERERHPERRPEPRGTRDRDGPGHQEAPEQARLGLLGRRGLPDVRSVRSGVRRSRAPGGARLSALPRRVRLAPECPLADRDRDVDLPVAPVPRRAPDVATLAAGGLVHRRDHGPAHCDSGDHRRPHSGRTRSHSSPRTLVPMQVRSSPWRSRSPSSGSPSPSWRRSPH